MSSIRRNEAPWNQTGFQKVADDIKRQQGIMVYIENILKEIMGDSIIQNQLSEKRKYLTEIIGTESDKGRPRDNIPSSFLPEQVVLTPEEAAKDVITPEIAKNMGERGRAVLTKLWIRQAHMLARKTASLVRGSPMIETTCCLSNIEIPGTFWRSAPDFPQLGKRSLVPYQQGQFLLTEFIPRPASSLVAEPDKELYYRIFLKYCFQGPRKGSPHEPGLTNNCPWCGFQFPTIPSVMDSDTEGKTALASQNVNTGTDEFISLLDTIHSVNKVVPLKKQELRSVSEIMDEFSRIEPAPIENWAEIIKTTTKNFLSLPADADKGDLALAAGPISEVTSNSEEIIRQRITIDAYQTLLENVVNLSWTNFFEVLQTYFVTPIQRLLSGFNPTSLFVPIEMRKELSDIHVKDDIQPILDNELSLITLKGEDFRKAQYNFARYKLHYFIKQLSSILPYKNKLRSIVVPGRDTTLVYIQRALLYGPLATLINPSEIPPGAEITSPVKSVGDPSMKFLLDIIVFSLNRFNKEKLSFNDQQIKEMIAIRDEKERANIIAEYNKLTDEERAIELMNQRLGIGKWAVGGTKLIYAYDKDYYDLERQKRIAAGIIDFPGSGSGEPVPPEGRPVDDFGFPIFTDNEFEREGGYNHNQHGDDDYE